jgi:hypothetical protein
MRAVAAATVLLAGAGLRNDIRLGKFFSIVNGGRQWVLS